MAADPDRWPKLPYAAWADTAATLQLWTQIVGKIRLALTPWLNHSWHVALYVTTRGLTTSPMPYGARSLQIDFDFVDHVLWLRLSDGQFRQLALKPMSVAEFYAGMMTALKELGIAVKISTMPCEIPNCMAFDQDTVHASYDADAANRFWRVLLAAHDVMARFRTGFLGKTSPVHFFWGSFDLAVTRFSGRTAPPPKSVTPNVAGWVMAEAYSHEVSSCGFWPGNGGYGRAAFYVYAYPEPAGYGDTRLRTAEAFYDKNVGQFILPYDAVAQARDPDALLLGFLQETYDAAANLAEWDRKVLERATQRARPQADFHRPSQSGGG
jgi:hypothetical protein